jgi:hypothetical protein
MDELALRWVVHHSMLSKEDAVILGASRIEQLEGNLKQIEKGPLEQRVVQQLDELWAGVKDDGMLFQISVSSSLLTRRSYPDEPLTTYERNLKHSPLNVVLTLPPCAHADMHQARSHNLGGRSVRMISHSSRTRGYTAATPPIILHVTMYMLAWCG